jgi:DNA-binding transcriptional regulator YiaG
MIDISDDISLVLSALSGMLTGDLAPILDAIERADPKLQLELGDAFKAGIGIARAGAALPDKAAWLLASLASAPVARHCFRMLRESAGITQRELAEKCGFDGSSVSYWESGGRALPEEAILALLEMIASRAAASILTDTQVAPPSLTGTQVVRLRRGLKMRQVDFAAAVGVSRAAVLNWEQRGNLPIPLSASWRVYGYAERERIDLEQIAA